ncbi:MAG: polysaccharide lyase 8 family protein [Clostridia bacterium]|nr:polysaccharide lyase 8 family protein [Clostridia bacterium]
MVQGKAKSIIAAVVILFMIVQIIPCYANSDEDYFNALAERAAEILTYKKGNTGNDVLQYVSNTKNSASNFMNFTDEYNLWSELNLESPSDLNTAFQRLLTMARAYKMGNGEDNAMKAAIIKALNLICEKYYYDKLEYGDNWWYFEIGIPTSFSDILILMNGSISDSDIETYVGRINYFCPTAEKRRDSSVTETGANRAWKAQIVVNVGIVTKNREKLEAGLKACEYLMTDSVTGDGFYQDGSFIQHWNVSYNGAYGRICAIIIADLVYINSVAGNTYDFTKWKEKLYQWAEKAFLPFIRNGDFMAMTRGRAIARSYETDHITGHYIIGFFTRLVGIADENDKKYFIGIVKKLLNDDKCSNFFVDGYVASIIDEIKDTTVSAWEQNESFKVFEGMDRAVMTRSDYSIGISMSSNRIYDYECSDKENIKGYNTGAGMVYIYNNQEKAYDDNFWCTVDANRLAGTTVDRDAEKSTGYYLSSEAWVGGAELGKYGCVGMSIAPYKSNLRGRKSWFCVGDELIAMGAGITNVNALTETIIENRKIDSEYKVFYNNSERDLNEETWYNTYWAYIAPYSDEGGEDISQSIGYYFPQKTHIKAKREVKEGSWNDIFVGSSGDILENEFFSMYINQPNANNANYAYAVLPCRTREEVRNYAINPTFEILENTKEIQAVKGYDDGKEITAVNFWEDKNSTVKDISCNTTASVVMSESDENIEIAVSNPPRTRGKKVELTINKAAASIINLPENIMVKALSPQIKLSVDTSMSIGKTYTITLSKTKQTEFQNIPDAVLLASTEAAEGFSSEWKAQNGDFKIEDNQIILSSGGLNRVYNTLENKITIAPKSGDEKKIYAIRWQQYLGKDAELGGNGNASSYDGQYLSFLSEILGGGFKKNEEGEIRPFLRWYTESSFGEQTIYKDMWYQMLMIVEASSDSEDYVSLYVYPEDGNLPQKADVNVQINGKYDWTQVYFSGMDNNNSQSLKFKNLIIEEYNSSDGKNAMMALDLAQNALSVSDMGDTLAYTQAENAVSKMGSGVIAELANYTLGAVASKVSGMPYFRVLHRNTLNEYYYVYNDKKLSGDIIISQFDDGRLINIAINSIDMINRIHGSIPVTEADNFKCMIWKSLSCLEPICHVAEQKGAE